MKKIIILFTVLFPFLTYGQKDNIGIYYQTADSIIKINPIKTSGHKTNTLGAALTMGIASSNVTVKFRGSKSINQINNPEFIFFFNPSMDYNLMTEYFNFANPSNVNSFLLVKLKSTKSGRELNWGKVNAYSGANVGIPDNSIIPVEIITVDDLTFKVSLADDLEAGEYAFVFDGVNGSGAFMPVFDFGIK